MDKATKYVLVATFISFLYSVYLFFFMDSPDSKLYGIFVGIWVPSILSAFTVLKSSIKKAVSYTHLTLPTTPYV